MIQTRGFQISNLPSYSAPDPSLVALNPQNISKGAGDALQLGQLFQYLQAKKAQEAELAATRDTRIRAANAGSLRQTATDEAFTPNAELEASTRRGQLGQMNTLFQPQTESMLASLNLSKLKANADAGLVPNEAELRGRTIKADLRSIDPITDAKIAQADLIAGTSDQDLSLLGQLGSLKQQRMAGESGSLADAATLRPDLFNLAQKTAQDKFLSFEADKKLADAEKAAKVKELEAQAKENIAKAGYWDSGGAPKRGPDPAQQVAALATAAKKIEDEYQLPAYAAARANKNILFPAKGLLGFGAETKEDFAKEQAQKIVDSYHKAIGKLVSGISGDVLGTNASAASGVSPEDAAALQWVNDRKNVNDPHYSAIVEKLMNKGILNPTR